MALHLIITLTSLNDDSIEYYDYVIDWHKPILLMAILENLKDWPEFQGQPFNGQQNFQSMTLGRVIIT